MLVKSQNFEIINRNFIKIFECKGFIKNKLLIIKRKNETSFNIDIKDQPIQKIIELLIKKDTIKGKLRKIENVLIFPHHGTLLFFENKLRVADFQKATEEIEDGKVIIKIPNITFNNKILSIVIRDYEKGDEGMIATRDINNNII